MAAMKQEYEYLLVAGGIGVIAYVGYEYIIKPIAAGTAAVQQTITNITNGATSLVYNNPVTQLGIATGAKIQTGSVNPIYNNATVVVSNSSSQQIQQLAAATAAGGTQPQIFVSENAQGVPTGIGTYGGSVTVPSSGNGSQTSPFTVSGGWQGVGYYKTSAGMIILATQASTLNGWG